jgi:hypothetical protein
MKKWLLTLGVIAGLHSSVPAEIITDGMDDKWLASIENYTYFIPHFKKLFSLIKTKTLLEFGMGAGTKYFLDTCNKVISIDFITHGYGPAVYQHFTSIYQEFPNWIPIAFFSGYRGDCTFAPYKYLASEHVYKACSYQTATYKNYAAIDDFYRIELQAFIASLQKCHKIDVAFVHPKLYLRSDLVELLFSKVPVIVATETKSRGEGNKEIDLLGYHRLVCPDDYEEIYLPGGAGTTVWVAKKETHYPLVQALKKYAEEL